jgi:hypothetical protein
LIDEDPEYTKGEGASSSSGGPPAYLQEIFTTWRGGVKDPHTGVWDFSETPCGIARYVSS